ncbi:hypothetical protein HPP92_024465 [Vanilla planifolia]|uniref:Cleavage and polyadenylation specificity factor subunit 3-II n=1 Tax=Vanilla planifolia TaxID=51239 RepID=A0A835PSA0_VANPL|nr:hypothetical protein HPP92_024465 [Vanilla planifolia]
MISGETTARVSEPHADENRTETGRGRAGQEVGKSCVLVSMGGRRIMFDCGMHMGHLDNRRYPDFSKICEKGDFNSALTCIVITHFHLDHVGALPYFTEVCGYNGPIFMSYPTKVLAPLMLEDYRKVMVERRGEEEQFTSDHIIECMKKVTPIDLKQVVQVDKDLQICAYYAGHVLGAVMIYAKVGGSAMVYTGDYNMTPDRHLGAAQIDCLELDLLITESTYATTIRDSKYAREREFLKAVHKCVASGGKVLIPTFALGRAQELCILLDDYWERMNLMAPIYFSAVCPFDRSLLNAPGPCVLFATPGMISGGFSLEAFKQWAPSEKNLVTLPGYCVAGTIGHKLMCGKPTQINLDKDTCINVRCQIHQLSFSPHTDAKGIMDLVGFLSPKHVMLVHGEKPKMATLKGRIETELGIPCFVPENNECVQIPSSQHIKVAFQREFLRNSFNLDLSNASHGQHCVSDSVLGHEIAEFGREERTAEGILVMEKNKMPKIVTQDELLHILGAEEHLVQMACCCPVKLKNSDTGERNLSSGQLTSALLQLLLKEVKSKIACSFIRVNSDHLEMESFKARVCLKKLCPHRLKQGGCDVVSEVFFCCSWLLIDDELARKVLCIMRDVELEEPNQNYLLPHQPFGRLLDWPDPIPT